MTPMTTEQIRALIARGKAKDTIFQALGIICLAIGLLVIFLLVGDMLLRGLARLNLEFFTSFASRKAAQSGILSAWVGTILVMFVTAMAAVPLGVAAGIYLEEYAKRNWVTDIIEINITNLAAVPSIVYGLLALGIFVYTFGFGQSILSAGLTLALLILPIVIVSTREAIRALYDTGFFRDVELRRDGGTLVVAVLERPTIESFEIKGNIALLDTTAKTFEIRGVLIQYGNAAFKDGLESNLSVDVRVEIKGSLNATGTVLTATEVEFKGLSDNGSNSSYEVKGAISLLDTTAHITVSLDDVNAARSEEHPS